MKSFNAKLLLFGEYGLMYGAEALAIPFSRFKGSLEFANGKEPDYFKTSQLELDRFVSYFNHHELNKHMNFPINLSEITKDLKNGLYFNSNIPLQYGVGSSGSLCAAIYEHYGQYQEDLGEIRKRKNLLSVLKNDFAVMEAYFHGKSSGFDPLVSFINRPVLLKGRFVNLPSSTLQPKGVSVYLIDTGEKSSTAPLVRLFMNKMNDEMFEKKFRNEFLPANNAAIESFLAGNTSQFFDQLKLIAAFQSENLQEMIPSQLRVTLNDLLEDDIPVKLLGSGGGGYLLAFVPEDKALPEKLKSLRVF